MHRKLCQLAITAASVSLIVGCSSDLSRTKAKTLIQSNHNFAVTIHIPGAPSTQDLEKDGLYAPWTFKGEARQYFNDNHDDFNATNLQNPIGREVLGITGITPNNGDQTEEIVEFNFRFKDVPSFVSKYAPTTAQTYPGIAIIKRYDDGWRIEGVHCSYETKAITGYYEIPDC